MVWMVQEGHTPLHLAAKYDAYQSAELLLPARAAIDTKDKVLATVP